MTTRIYTAEFQQEKKASVKAFPNKTQAVAWARERVQDESVSAMREHWLQRAISRYIQQWAKLGVTVPADVRVTCGFPGGGSPTKRIGECWPRSRSQQGVNEVFINPVLADSGAVLNVLGHELVHAVDDCQHKQGAVFSRICAKVGYSGGKNAMAEAQSALDFQASVAKALGDYPHAAVVLVKEEQKESSGLHKFICGNGGSDALYSTAKMVEENGVPTCRCHGEDMEPAERKTKSVVQTI
jgi:hypothetical protein